MSQIEVADARLNGFRPSHQWMTSPGAISSLDLTPSVEGEQFAILELMRHCLYRYDENEFHSQKERPGYDPSQRLTFRSGEQIVGHIRCVVDQVWLHEELHPLIKASEFVFAPEHLSSSNVDRFFASLDRLLQSQNIDFLLHRTTAAMASRLERFGWISLSQSDSSWASTETFLANMQSSQQDAEPTEAYWIRHMRQVEVDALVNLFGRWFASHQIGSPRSEAMWEWILRRNAFDAVYVAIRGGNKLAWEDADDRMAGYAIVRDHRIIELVATEDDPEVRRQLVSRICRDLYEVGWKEFQYQAPAQDPTHQLLKQAESHTPSASEPHTMMRMPNPIQQLAEHCTRLHQKATQHGMKLPIDLGLQVDGQRFQIQLGKKDSALVDGKLGRKYLTLTSAQLGRLLLGDLPIADLASRGEIGVSAQNALELATRLFPFQPPWISSVEDLPLR